MTVSATFHISPTTLSAAFSQVSPAYAKIPLGISTTTIGGYGCLITSMASAMYDWHVTIDGRYVDPATLNRWLSRNGGFTSGPGSTQENRFVFGSVALLGVELVKVINCSAQPAPSELIARYLSDPEYAVLAEVDFIPGGARQQHWVRLLPEWANITLEDQLTGISTDVMIMDPWMPPGYNFRWLMPAYALPAWPDPARAIFRLAIYRHPQNEGDLTHDFNRNIYQRSPHKRPE